MNHTDQAAASIAAGAGASAASVWTIANDAAHALFGVPIGVVLAAAAGAFFGRTFTPASSFGGALRGWLAWTLAGAYTLPLALHLLGWPSKIQGAVAFVLALALQLLAPVLVPVIVKGAPAWLQALADRFSGRSPGGGQ